ncbi:hypothetical protein H1R20_g5209, partial [Candolleomyces eurysporus]
MLNSPSGGPSGNLPPQSGSFWGKFKQKPKEPDPPSNPQQMAVARTRLLTLVFGDMETIRVLPNSFVELDALARDWTKPPPDAIFTLRVPVEFASFQAARLVSGPFIYLTGEDSFQIATMGIQGLRVEIVSDAPPPPDDPPPPPPPPILEMPASFNLELTPGQFVALDVEVISDELDMARMEDGTTVDGQFWGCLDIVHQGDTHKMDFSGTRLPPNDVFTPDFMLDSKILSKLALATKPPMAKCSLAILAPTSVYCEVILSFSPLWKIGTTWPMGENIEENKVKYFVRVHPGGALENIEQQVVTTAVYYEAINNLSLFAGHKNIAYRLLSPGKIAAAIDITVTQDPCIFTRIFLIWRGVSDEEMGNFAESGEKEANTYNWREVIGWSEDSKDSTMFRVLETSILELF